MTISRMVGKANGGSNRLTNLALTHGQCNVKRANQTQKAWYRLKKAVDG